MHSANLRIWSNADSDSGGLQEDSRFCISNKLLDDADATSPQHTSSNTLRFCPKYRLVLSILNEIVNAKRFTVDGEFSSLFDHKLLEDKACLLLFKFCTAGAP